MLGIFDEHNDSVQRMQEYRPGGIDFLARTTDGHLNLPRAMDGSLAADCLLCSYGPITHR
jgi:membrane dipeptidase